ncbi:hypothetical protein Cni_G04745 [Canna indica]|uniref:RING-type domain-containing protein n=1 Tax=Canna indica TaxID=4628 RepID=A0AAQ3Q2Z8_9LILI|nr:hypothetical protein Cni_G04745 [Canna indica]
MEDQRQIAPFTCSEGEVTVEKGKECCVLGVSAEECGFCAICLEKIALQEMALVKGCEHAYCVMCILRWASYKDNPSCPQCKLPFDFLIIHRALDGSIHDYMFEESVCLLLRTSWFVPMAVEAQVVDAQEVIFDEVEYLLQYQYDDEIDDLEETYFVDTLSSIRIGNRRWGDNGYVRAGRKEARPINSQFPNDADAGPSRGSKKKEASKDNTGRRAKRALKREAADKAVAAKHQLLPDRLGLN